jgi:ADP-heptose:LPS heptosyltransferase
LYKIINRKKLVATAVADSIGRVLFGLPRLLRKSGRIPPEDVRDILVIRTAYIGDVVMTLPILKPLRELYPRARIAFLTASGAVDVLKENPFVDEVIAYDPPWFYPSSTSSWREFINRMRRRTFDLVIETRADIREILLLAWPLRASYRVSYDVGGGGYLLTHCVPYPGLRHKVEYHLDLVRYLGYRGRDLEWGIYLSPEERQGVREIMERKGTGEPFIAVHPGGRLPLKRWPARHFAAVCGKLTEKYGMPVVVFGSENERPIVEEMISSMKRRPVVLAGEVSLREMAGILSHASVFLCNDSGPMHIAAAMKTPTVAVFGPSKSAETGPFGGEHRVVEKAFPCRPTCDESSCRFERYNACMEDVSPEDVFRAADDLIRSKGAHVPT